MNKRVIVPLVLAILVITTTGTYAASSVFTPSTDLAQTANQDTPDVPERVEVTDAMVNDARQRAVATVRRAQDRSRPGTTGVDSSTGLVNSAASKLDEAENASDPMSALVANRRATVDARASIAFEKAKTGSLTADGVRAEAADVRSELDRAKQRLATECTTERCLVALGEVQRSLAAADNWLDQVPRLLNHSRTDARGIGYAASAVTAARLNIEDAEELHTANSEHIQSQTTGAEPIDVDARYHALHDIATSKLNAVQAADGSYAASVVEQARGYLTSAEQRYENGYEASATIHLMKAILMINATSNVAGLPGPVTADENSIAPADVDSAKDDAVDALSNGIDANSDDPLALTLLKMAESRLESGDDLISRASQTNYKDSESLIMGYANYLLAQQISEDASEVSDLGQ